MTTPDSIHDAALLTVSAWQRSAFPSHEEAMLMLYRDQARRWAAQDNHQDHYSATLDAVREAIGSDQHV